MSAPAFTPGPWDWWDDGESLVRITDAAEQKLVARTLLPSNARLIAAAPELYEALERVLAANKARAEWPDNDSTNRFDAMLMECEWAEEAACAILAKARGDAK